MREFAGWQQAIAGHDYWEWQRFERADLWYPLEFGTPTDRVDVVGGVPDGWRQLLTTFGATVVASGTPLLVMDLTQERVADGLVELSRDDWKVRELQLPRDVDQLDLLAGLTADEVAEVLAEAAETMRGTPDPALRATDTDVLRAVAQRLDGSFTIHRLTAGLRVLQRIYDPDDSLTPEEVTRLTRHIDLVGSGERVQDQLRFLRVALDMVADPASTAGAAPATVDRLWRDAIVTVIATNNSSRVRKDFTDRVLFHSLLQRLRGRQSVVKGQVLVIAGADHLGEQALETMAKQARATGVRLVYLFEHLRDGTQRLLGGSHSATMIMRLGPAAEAAAAAEYIGRGYSFKLSQITRQLGATDTLGGGDSQGTSTSRTWSEQGGTSISGTHSGLTVSNSGGTSYSESIGAMSQQMSNWAHATSVTAGSTDQRVYEFTVEPRTIQTLPMTAFILVEGGAQGRRAAVADCNPAIASVDRVAAHPRTAPHHGLTR